MNTETDARHLLVSLEDVKQAVYAALAVQGVCAGAERSRIPGLEMDRALDVMAGRAAALLTIMTGCRIEYVGAGDGILDFTTDVKGVSVSMLTAALAERLLELTAPVNVPGTGTDQALMRLIETLDAAECPPTRPLAQY